MWTKSSTIAKIYVLPDSSDGLSVTEPKVNLKLLATINLGELDVHSKVLERSVQGALGAGHGDLTSLGSHSDYKSIKHSQAVSINSSNY